ncbi:MAG TPA: hypothetical protein VGA53_05255 [Candidatus Paceibacterota bacterium]
MNTVTLQKTESEDLKKKASLYEKVFRFISRQSFGIESYSDKQIKEFKKEDRLDSKTRQKLERLLKSS